MSRRNQEVSIEDFINKVCSEFANKIESKLDKKLDKIHDKLNGINNTLDSLNIMISDNKKAITDVEDSCDIVRQFTKRNALRIHGLQEEREGESVITNTVNFLNNTLHINCSEDDIDSAFRLGDSKRHGKKPRIVLMNLVRNCMHSVVLEAKKQLKGTGVSIFEDLTKKRFNLLMAAKKKFGDNRVWSSGGKIYFWDEQMKRRQEICSSNDL